MITWGIFSLKYAMAYIISDILNIYVAEWKYWFKKSVMQVFLL